MRRLEAYLLLPLLAGCGQPSPAKDMRAGDMSMPPGNVDMAIGSEPDLATLPPAGTRIVDTKLLVQAVTEDDHAVLADSEGAVVSVIPLKGGPLVNLSNDATRVAVRGKLVFVFSAYDDPSRSADLAVWSAAKGLKDLGSGAFLQAGQSGSFYRVAATADSQYIFYTLGTTDADKTDLWIAKADGTAAKKVFSQVRVDEMCAPRLFAAGNKFFVAPCPSGGDGGAVVRSGYAIDPATGMVTTLKSPGDVISADKNGAKAVILNEAKDAFVIPSTGGVATPLDSKVEFGYLLPDGTAALIRGTDSTLRRAVPGQKATVLVDKEVGQLREPSPSYKHLLYAKKFNSNNFWSDLYLVPTDKASPPQALSATDDGAIFGDAFTADSSRVLYFTKCTMEGIGIFNTKAVGGGAVAEHGKKVWLTWATKGSTVLYNDNYVAQARRFQRADILLLDVAKQDPPRLLVKGADVDFYLNTAKDKMVYTWGVDPSKQGLYVAPAQ